MAIPIDPATAVIQAETTVEYTPAATAVIQNRSERLSLYVSFDKNKDLRYVMKLAPNQTTGEITQKIYLTNIASSAVDISIEEV